MSRLKQFTAWPYLVASSFLFLLPFERIPSLEVHGITVRLTSLLIVLFAITVLPGLLRDGDITLRSAIDKSILAFYGWGWVSILFATNKHRSLMVMVLWTFVLLGYVLVSRLWRQYFDAEAIQRIILTTGVITALFGLYQFVANTYFGVSNTLTLLSRNYTREILGFARVQSVGVEPLYYGAFLFLPICFLMVKIARSKHLKISEALSFVVLLIAFVLTVSRGAYLGMIATGVVLFVVFLLKRAVHKGVVYVIALSMLAFVISQGMIYAKKYFNPGTGSGNTNTEQQFVEHALGGQATRDSSLGPRLDAIKDAWSLYKTKPVTGLGIGNYGVVTTLQKTTENPYPIVNNQYLETLTEMGPVGFVLMLLMIAVTLVKVVRVSFQSNENGWYAVALLGVVAGLGIQWNFFSTIYILLIWVLIGLIDAVPYGDEV